MLYLPPCSKTTTLCRKLPLCPGGQARGLTWFTPNEEQGLVSRSQLLDRIAATLGGRAAEDIVFGRAEVTTGAGQDLQQVSGLARQMVTKFGMSDLGLLSLENQPSEVFLGRDWMTKSEYSEEIAAQIDAQVREIINYCYQQAKRLLQENRIVMDYLVDLLSEQETIEGDQFRKIVAEYTQTRDQQLAVSR